MFQTTGGTAVVASSPDIGVVRVGVYVPRNRLAASEVGAFWSRRGKAATTAIANWDEDPITMAVAAAERCLEGEDRDSVTAILFASTSFPYAEKQNAAVVAEALGIKGLTLVVDLGSSLGAGLDALRLGIEHVAAVGGRALVLAADKRVADPGTPEETRWGDAGVAFLVGTGASSTVEFVHNVSETALTTWRFPGESFRHADARFVSERAADALTGSLAAIRDGAAARGQVLAAAIVISDVGREADRALARVGLGDAARSYGPGLQQSIGFTGVAAPLIAMAEALAEATPGEVLGLAVQADGARGALIACGAPVTVKGAMKGEGAAAIGYPEFLRIRGHLGEQVISPYSSEIQQWRDREVIAGPVGSREKATGQTVFPPRSLNLQEQDGGGSVELVPLARRGTLYTFTVEHLFPNPEGRLAMGVIELDDGARFYCQIADMDPEALEVGMSVELSYRRIHEGGGFINYFWKAVPQVADREGRS
jgi:hydroxymethylglutaryl-CoA synthase